MSVDTLKRVSHFMSLEPVTGFNIVNNILAIPAKLGGPKIYIPLDAPGINVIARVLMARELNMYFSRIRREDVPLSYDDLHEKYSEEEIDMICFRRGIEIDDHSKKEKIMALKLWLSISNQRNVPHSLLLYTRVNDYNNEMF